MNLRVDLLVTPDCPNAQAAESLLQSTIANGPGVDAVITLCAEEVCPVWLGEASRVHWPLPDPAAATGSDDEALHSFRSVRDELSRRLTALFQ